MPVRQTQAKRKGGAGNGKEPPPTAAVWEAYALAYFSRYGTEPVRNARVNGQLANFITRVPRAEAPLIARHFVESNNRWYVSKGHSVQCMLGDAEKVAMEWRTQRHVTDREAQVADKESEQDAMYERVRAKLQRQYGGQNGEEPEN